MMIIRTEKNRESKTMSRQLHVCVCVCVRLQPFQFEQWICSAQSASLQTPQKNPAVTHCKSHST